MINPNDYGPVATYEYDADTSQFTILRRSYTRTPLATVTVSMEDSHLLMRAIDRIYADARAAGISHACCAIDNLTESLMTADPTDPVTSRPPTPAG